MRRRAPLALALALMVGLGAAAWLWLRPPAATGAGAVTAAAVASVLQRLDDCFDHRDADRYVETFAWDDPLQRELLHGHLRQLFAGAPLQRRSAATGEVHRIGRRSVVFVQRQYRRDPQAAAADAADAVWLALGERDGRTVPTAVFAAATSEAGDPQQPFRCPACNYQVGGVDGWLCVPGRPDRAETVENVTFALLGTDVRCDVDVGVGDQAVAAAALATGMADAMRQLLPPTRTGAVEPWLPPSLAAAPPPPVTGARLRLDLPDGTAVLLHAVCLGALHHTLSVRGAPAALAREATSIAALLSSYRMLQTDVDAATAAAMPIRVHQGSALQDGRYHNQLYHLRCDGPADWQADAKASGAAFSVAWRCPRQTGRMCLTGYLPPPSLAQWLPADADQWLDDLCRRADLRIDPEHQGEWCDDDKPLLLRQVVLLPRQSTADQPERRLLKLVLRPDLLVVLDGYTTAAGDEDALRRAFATLQFD